jgi:Predicted transcriptional regulators
MSIRKPSSTYTRNEQCIINCDLTYAVHKIGGRWKLLILSKLQKGTARFSDLKKEFSYITERMLALQLRALEQDGLVTRKAYAEMPPRVEYQLTDIAKQLLPVLDQLSVWGNQLRAHQHARTGTRGSDTNGNIAMKQKVL